MRGSNSFPLPTHFLLITKFLLISLLSVLMGQHTNHKKEKEPKSGRRRRRGFAASCLQARALPRKIENGASGLPLPLLLLFLSSFGSITPNGSSSLRPHNNVARLPLPRRIHICWGTLRGRKEERQRRWGGHFLRDSYYSLFPSLFLSSPCDDDDCYRTGRHISWSVRRSY